MNVLYSKDQLTIPTRFGYEWVATREYLRVSPFRATRRKAAPQCFARLKFLGSLRF